MFCIVLIWIEWQTRVVQGLSKPAASAQPQQPPVAGAPRPDTPQDPRRAASPQQRSATPPVRGATPPIGPKAEGGGAGPSNLGPAAPRRRPQPK